MQFREYAPDSGCVENEQDDAGQFGRDIKFSGANGDSEKMRIFCSAEHERDWQPYPVNPCCAFFMGLRQKGVHLPVFAPKRGTPRKRKNEATVPPGRPKRNTA